MQMEPAIKRDRATMMAISLRREVWFLLPVWLMSEWPTKLPAYFAL